MPVFGNPNTSLMIHIFKLYINLYGTTSTFAEIIFSSPDPLDMFLDLSTFSIMVLLYYSAQQEDPPLFPWHSWL